MAESLRAKFNQWIVIFVLLPAALSMAICFLFFWRLLRQNRDRILTDKVTVISTAMEQTLRAEALRMKTFANLPVTTSLITMAARRTSTGGDKEESKVETDWAAASREDMIVRGVLDNDIALLFRATCAQNSQITMLSLSDGDGALLAASSKPAAFYQYRNDWWSMTQSAPSGQVASEGVTPPATMGLLLLHQPSQNTPAVVRSELDLHAVIGDGTTTGSGAQAEHVGIFLVSNFSMPVAGATSEIGPEIQDELVARVNESGILKGWFENHRYDGKLLDAGIYWARPVWIIAIRQENRLPASFYVPLLMALAITCATIFAVFIVTRRMGRSLFFDPMHDAAEAGLWVLRRAGKKTVSPEIRGLIHPWAKLQYDKDTPLHKNLDEWFAAVQKSAQGEVAKLSVETEHDLELATEFQEAFMNRPPPAVPAVYTEGRLRLEFRHVYKPALALGGDFFDITSVAPDCASILIADVMGHGTRSALLASTIRTLLSEHHSIGRNPAHFLKELNKSLCFILRGLPGQYFASACHFAADTTSRVGTYSLAGHPTPFHLNCSLGRVGRLERPRPRGAALGVFAEEEFGAISVRLVDGDAFVFYTDGAYEATDHAGVQFGMVRLEKSMQAHIYEPPDELLKKVLADIQTYCGDEPLADDICLVSVHVTTKPPAQA